MKGATHAIKCLLTLLLGCVVLAVWSQPDVFRSFPEELQWFNKEIIYKEFSDPEASRLALDSLEKFAIDAKDNRYLGWARYYRGYLHKNGGLLDSAGHFLGLALELGETAGYVDHLLLQNAYNALGNVYSYRGNSRSELTQHFEALPHARASEDRLAIATTVYNIGKVMTKMGHYTDAIPYMEECLRMDLELNDSLNIALDYVAISKLHRKLEQYDQALEFCEEAEVFASEEKHPYQYGRVLVNWGDTHLAAGNSGEARQLFERALALGQTRRDSLGILNASHGLARTATEYGSRSDALLMIEDVVAMAERRGNKEIQLQAQILRAQLGLGPNSIGFLQRTLSLARQVGGDDHIRQAHQLLIDAHRQRGESEAALRVQDSLVTYLNKRTATKIDLASHAYNLRVDLSEAERDLMMAGAESKFQERKLILQRIALVVTLVGLLLLSLLIYRLVQKNALIRQQNVEIEKAYLEKDTLLREIHHRVKNNLQVISSLLSLQGRYSENPLVEDAIRKGKDRVKSMSLIHQNLYQHENLTGVDINEYLEKLFLNLFDSYNIEPGRISLYTDIEEISLDIETVIPIGLVVNELVSNALKYAFPNETEGEVRISLKEVDNQLELTVKDDGVGMSDTSPVSGKESFGFKLINTFKAKLKADLEVHSEDGTEVRLIIKKYDKVA